MLLSLLTVLILAAPALASEPIQTEKNGSLTIENFYDELPLANVPFSLYRVAEVSQDGTFALLPAYEGSGAAVNGLTKAKEWRASTETLAAWIQTQKLQPDAKKTTDKQGKAEFSRLSTGLYLVVGEQTRIGDKRYTCSPSLAAIPEQNEESGSWDYAVTIEPKNTVKSVQNDPPTKPDKKTDDPKPNKKLPNTGVLQWPIPTLAGIGVACMFLGWCLSRKNGNNK